MFSDNQQKKLKVTSSAANRVCDFLELEGNGVFPNLDRDEVGIGLLMRISDPGIIAQKHASLCGPTSLLFSIATHRPFRYVEFAADLYDKGRGTIGELTIKPCSDTRNYKPAKGSISPVDWLTAASIRDSENWFFDYQTASNEFAGITMPNEMASWFERAGFRDVRNVTNVYFTKGDNALDDIKRLMAKGFRICLFINSNMVKSAKQTVSSTFPDHWVVLRKVHKSSKVVDLEIYNQGTGKFRVPKTGELLTEDFFKNFYGYVAARP
ncbi:hypothetical protein HOV93_47230 [Planctomycetes bacterium FF15]|uniref:Uncharacterized protein n=2 Tax=Bremerella alba TaxID=980252 RepID=A0A7V8V9N4_9BACT|nr:hypothetical protein [Bremerella alba]